MGGPARYGHDVLGDAGRAPAPLSGWSDAAGIDLLANRRDAGAIGRLVWSQNVASTALAGLTADVCSGSGLPATTRELN